MEERGPVAVLDDYLPRPVRTYLEERFWRPIEAQATLEVLCDDPAFLADPGRHPAIFADCSTRSTAYCSPAVLPTGIDSSTYSAWPWPTSMTSAWWT